MDGMELKLLRISKRVLQWDLAKKVGISPAKLSLIENGRRRVTPELAKLLVEGIEELARNEAKQ